MKVAVTSTGSTLDSKLDHRFGRCNYFVICDTEHGNLSFIKNPNAEAEQGAGPASVQLIASHGVNKIISGEFGIKIKSMLDSLHMQMVIVKDPDKKIKDIINMLNH